MISLAAALLFSRLQPIAETHLVEADQDVWVYPHSSDPGGTAYLYAWGTGEKSVAANAGEAEEFSYSYLRFSFDKVPSDKKLVGAYLFLKPVGTPKISPDAKNWPFEVRPLKGAFTEKDWDYSKIGDVAPSTTEVYGTGIVSAGGGAGSEQVFEIKIDLLGKDSKFATAFSKLQAEKKPMHLAITSKFNVGDQGKDNLVKFFSRDNKDEMVRPRLVLKFE